MSRPAHHKAGIQEWGDDNDQEFTIYPKDISIVWGNDSRYWRLPTDDNGPAELIQVSWLEVTAIAKVERNKKCRVEFEVEVEKNGFGWNNTKVLVMAKAGKREKYIYKQVVLSTDGSKRKIPTEVSGALEIEMNSEDLLHFGLYELWRGNWKGGLLVKKAKITKLSGPENKITNLSIPENKINNLSGPKNKITNLPNPENKITNLSGPENKSTNLSGPENKSTNLSGPENKSTNLPGPENKITNLSGPENKSTNLSGPGNKIIKISIPEEDPDYCGPVVNEFINYKCNVQFISLTSRLVRKNKGL